MGPAHLAVVKRSDFELNNVAVPQLTGRDATRINQPEVSSNTVSVVLHSDKLENTAAATQSSALIKRSSFSTWHDGMKELYKLKKEASEMVKGAKTSLKAEWETWAPKHGTPDGLLPAQRAGRMPLIVAQKWVPVTRDYYREINKAFWSLRPKAKLSPKPDILTLAAKWTRPNEVVVDRVRNEPLVSASSA